MDIVCDTNVWYDIGAGSINPTPIKNRGDRLLISPVSFLEIGSKISSDNFSQRRNAAKAVVAHADEILPDPERHLANLWNEEIDDLAIDWMDGFKAIAQAPDFESITRGVVDSADQVIRTVDVPTLEGWRGGHWDDFSQKIVMLIDTFFPGYAKKRAKGQAKYMGEQLRKSFRAHIDHEDLIDTLVLATRARLFLHNSAIGDPNLPEFKNAKDLLRPYAEGYREYIFNVATKYAPQPNDWGDLECFVYLQDGRQLLTSDQRWVDILNAVDGGLVASI